MSFTTIEHLPTIQAQREDSTTKAAPPRAKLSRRGLRWALEGIVCQHLTVARVAEGLAVSWNTANDAALPSVPRANASSSATPAGSTTSP